MVVGERKNRSRSAGRNIKSVVEENSGEKIQ